MVEAESAQQLALYSLYADEIGALVFDEYVPDPSDFTPVFIELSTGHRVVLAVRKRTMVESVEPFISSPWTYWAIRVYVAGDRYDNRLRRYAEFRAGIEFELSRLRDIWAWLESFAAGRTIFEFDYAEDLLEFIADYLSSIFLLDDAYLHLVRRRWVCIPALFNKMDN